MSELSKLTSSKTGGGELQPRTCSEQQNSITQCREKPAVWEDDGQRVALSGNEVQRQL